MDSHFYVLPCIYTILVLPIVVLNRRSMPKGGLCLKSMVYVDRLR